MSDLSKIIPETVPCKWCKEPTSMLGTKMCDRCWELERRMGRDMKIAEKIILSIKTHKAKRTEKEIENVALIISKRVMDEWYGGEEFPEDCQLFEEILCGLLQDNPEECERLIGTAFCEEEEIKDD